VYHLQNSAITSFYCLYALKLFAYLRKRVHNGLPCWQDNVFQIVLPLNFNQSIFFFGLNFHHFNLQLFRKSPAFFILQLLIEIFINKAHLIPGKAMLSVEQGMPGQQNHPISIVDEGLIEFVQTLILVSYLLQIGLNLLLVRDSIYLHLFSLLLELK